MTVPDINVTIDGGVATVEIARPPHNYFDETLITAIADALAALDADNGCRAVVLCSQGKNFCAGANFGDGGGFGNDRVAVSERLYRQAMRLFDSAKPVIAAVQGAAVGGGLGLACAADFRVADPGSRFVANFARLGFHQGFGLSVTLPAIVGQQAAKAMLLSGGGVRGEEAARIGLADRLVAPGTQNQEALAWAAELAAAAPLAVQSIRRTLRGDLADRVRAALEHELAEQTRLWNTADAAEGIAASLDRRPPAFTGT
jgi:2-(1,2-epoxy-1,2-dihydrophenyl)acetyl-CoA isomerase